VKSRAKTLLILALVLILTQNVLADQTLLLTSSTCRNTIGAAAITAAWRNADCPWADGWTGVGYRCLLSCAINGQPGVNCTTKACAASYITMDAACQAPTSALWIFTLYTGQP